MQSFCQYENHNWGCLRFPGGTILSRAWDRGQHPSVAMHKLSHHKPLNLGAGSAKPIFLSIDNTEGNCNNYEQMSAKTKISKIMMQNETSSNTHDVRILSN
jgi:hypothetical protein